MRSRPLNTHETVGNIYIYVHIGDPLLKVLIYLCAQSRTCSTCDCTQHVLPWGQGITPIGACGTCYQGIAHTDAQSVIWGSCICVQQLLLLRYCLDRKVLIFWAPYSIIVPLMQCNTNAYISRHMKLKKRPDGPKLK
jgi:hypothetical protein